MKIACYKQFESILKPYFDLEYLHVAIHPLDLVIPLQILHISHHYPYTAIHNSAPLKPNGSHTKN